MGEIYGLATWCWLLFECFDEDDLFYAEYRILVENYVLEARGGLVGFYIQRGRKFS